jgi:osmotically-inducible protein OsmY
MRYISILLILLLMAPLLIQAQTPSADDRIYDDVRRRLADDLDVRGAGLQVTVKDGKVTLEGRVRDDVGRQKATRIAKKVKGVISVDNKLKIPSDT